MDNGKLKIHKQHSSDPFVRVVEEIEEGDRLLRHMNNAANTRFFASGSAAELLEKFDPEMEGVADLKKRLARLQKPTSHS
tara:strand:- start:30 stop:269 length:240 start_codon:yes stop_codon:yes gene_type:complete